MSDSVSCSLSRKYIPEIFDRDSQDDSIPEGSVPLHRLCDRCRQMFVTWDKSYAWFQDDWRDLEPFRGYGKYELCTLAELMESRQSCHLCEILYSQIGQDDIIPLNEPIVCRIGLPSLGQWSSKWDKLEMSLLLSGRVLSSNCAAICKFGSSDDRHDEFSCPFMAKHIPRQSAGNLVQMQKWLRNCRAKHHVCNNWYPGLDTKGSRPTRVVELDKDGVRLRCDTRTIDNFEYLALSHMWGKSPSTQLRLTDATLQEFQEAIPIHKLSSTFSEAIRITRSLGFSYLWIDSLCIIQDSTADWLHEANMMSAVYNNAVCTIAFLFSPGVDFCQTRDDPRASTPCIVRGTGADWRWRGFYIVPKEGRISRFSSSTWPLSIRAWVLQEHLLSPRTILFGHRAIMWECGQRFYDELTFPDTERNGVASTVALKPQLSMYRGTKSPRIDASLKGDLDIWVTFPPWARLIREYRRRNLSYASDRIIAIVGIARASQTVHGLTYLAGMWKEHLPRSLLWYIETANVRKMAEPFSIREPSSKPVPTWSWLGGPIYMHCDVVIPGGNGGNWDPNLFVAKFLHFRWSNGPVNHAPSTAYYDFDGLRITLELATHRTKILPKEPYGEHNCHRLSCDSLEENLASCLGLDRKRLAASYHCDDLTTLHQPPAEVHIALIAEEVDLNYRHDLQGLALAPVVESGTWKRLGYWKAWVDLGDYRRETESLFLRIEGVKIETLTLV